MKRVLTPLSSPRKPRNQYDSPRRGEASPEGSATKRAKKNPSKKEDHQYVGHAPRAIFAPSQDASAAEGLMALSSGSPTNLQFADPMDVSDGLENFFVSINTNYKHVPDLIWEKILCGYLLEDDRTSMKGVCKYFRDMCKRIETSKRSRDLRQREVGLRFASYEWDAARELGDHNVRQCPEGAEEEKRTRRKYLEQCEAHVSAGTMECAEWRVQAGLTPISGDEYSRDILSRSVLPHEWKGSVWELNKRILDIPKMLSCLSSPQSIPGDSRLTLHYCLLTLRACVNDDRKSIWGDTLTKVTSVIIECAKKGEYRRRYLNVVDCMSEDYKEWVVVEICKSWKRLLTSASLSDKMRKDLVDIICDSILNKTADDCRHYLITLLLNSIRSDNVSFELVEYIIGQLEDISICLESLSATILKCIVRDYMANGNKRTYYHEILDLIPPCTMHYDGYSLIAFISSVNDHYSGGEVSSATRERAFSLIEKAFSSYNDTQKLYALTWIGNFFARYDDMNAMRQFILTADFEPIFQKYFDEKVEALIDNIDLNDVDALVYTLFAHYMATNLGAGLMKLIYMLDQSELSTESTLLLVRNSLGQFREEDQLLILNWLVAGLRVDMQKNEEDRISEELFNGLESIAREEARVPEGDE